MQYFGNETLGIIFVILAFVLTFLMFYLWKFPYDHERHKSDAPNTLRLLHRGLGYAYLLIYVLLMWDMVPRLWSYQVELPARTVAHLVFGMAIGAILITKIVIVRFFKHMEAKLAPALGTSLFVLTLLLMGLALPFSLREAFLRESALMGDTFSDERVERVRTQLPKSGLKDKKLLSELATSEGLFAGRDILINKCTQCHDLRTVLARPRTPEVWRQTVERMANRSTVLNVIDEREQWQVTAYLVAISPTLQRTARMRRQNQLEEAESQAAMRKATDQVQTTSTQQPSFDLAAAQKSFENRCSQCHSPLVVQAAPPRTEEAANQLVARMVRNGLRASDDELAQIVRYLTITYAKSTENSAPATKSASPAQAVPNTAPVPTEAQGSAGVVAVDQTITIRPKGNNLEFESKEITVKSGKRVRAVLENASTSGLIHNFILVRSDDKVDEVTDAALAAAGRGFLPEHEAIIAGIPATDGGSSGSVEFVAPAPGNYTYLCMMPGHSFTMRGSLKVVKE